METLDSWSRDMLNFYLLEKGLRLFSPPHFVYGFSRNFFLMLCSINWPNLIVWLPLLLEIFGKYVLPLFVSQVVTSTTLKLTLSFKSSCFSNWPKSQDKNLDVLKIKRAYKVKQKRLFFNFQRAFSCQNLSQIWECAFN